MKWSYDLKKNNTNEIYIYMNSVKNKKFDHKSIIPKKKKLKATKDYNSYTAKSALKSTCI